MPMNITFREAEPSDAGKFLEYCKTVGAESDNLTLAQKAFLSAFLRRRILSANIPEIRIP